MLKIWCNVLLSASCCLYPFEILLELRPPSFSVGAIDILKMGSVPSLSTVFGFGNLGRSIFSPAMIFSIMSDESPAGWSEAAIMPSWLIKNVRGIPLTP